MQYEASPSEHPGQPLSPDLRNPPQGASRSAPAPAPSLGRWLLIYSTLRIGLLVVLAALLSLLMPLILAVLFAVVLALPLSWVIFSRVRGRVNEAMAISTAQRRAERERLRTALDGPGPQ